jgi:nitrate reductase gamma subunit
MTMTLFDFARGPGLQIAMTVFVFGVIWRLTALLLLPWAKDRTVARPDAPMALVGGIKGFVRHLWLRQPYVRTHLFQTLNGYVFHIGLAIVVFGFAQHILFIRGLTGASWPSLPGGVIALIAVVTLASLIVALTRRLTSPVLRLISTANDYFSWLVTFLPVLSGIVAVNHLFLPYEMLAGLHVLSIDLLLIWFPFGKLMHAFFVFLTRTETAIFYGRRGVEI